MIFLLSSCLSKIKEASLTLHDSFRNTNVVTHPHYFMHGTTSEIFSNIIIFKNLLMLFLLYVDLMILERYTKSTHDFI